MTEDFSEEDIVCLVFGFEHLATDGAVGASQVAGFPGSVEGAEGGGNVRWSCGPVVVGPCLFGGSGRWRGVRELFG
jgi:hypothetical protein